MEENGIDLTSPELQMLRLNKQSGYNYRKRRQDDWTENYLLYRDRVKINRLTQRQSVNIPLMKQTVRTLLKEIDDMPVIEFENLDNDKDAEIFQNEYWKWTISPEVNNMELQDVVDKRQEMLFGRTYDQMQIANGRVEFTIQDPQDILIDRYTDPTNIDTARFLIHMHIFRPLSALANDKNYDQEAVKRMQDYYATQQGLIKAADNLGAFQEKNRKMSEMGVPDIESPVLGETYVELSLHFVYREKDSWVNDAGEKVDANEQYMMYVECDDMEILQKKPLEAIIGTTGDNYWRNHLPYNSWAEDVERQDWFSDGVGDIVRPINKVLNVWISQLTENRTFRSFGMNYYDSGLEGFQPPNVDPEPWGWVALPVPQGKTMADVLQRVDIPDLGDTIADIEFLMSINDRSTGATATQEGVPSQRQITLGEVQLALQEARSRAKSMSKFYTNCWMKRAEKFLKFIEAAPDKLDAVKIYKQGKNSSNIFARDIAPKDWMTKSGYRVRIWSQEDKNKEDEQQLTKLSALRLMIPGNSKLEEVIDRKALEYAGLKPDDINEIIRIEQQKRDAMANMPPMLPGGAPSATPTANPRQPMPAPAPVAAQ